MHSRHYSLVALAIVSTLAAGQVSAAINVPISVPGTSDPYLAGMPNGSTCCGGDSAPAQSPVLVTGLTLTPSTALSFAVTGSVNFTPSPPTDPPDGSALVATPSNNGIAGVTAPANSLVGVFLDNSQPDSSPAPASLDFGVIGTSFTTLSPGLKQVFFIGDGLTGNGTGAVQSFIVPAGATRLFLGTEDGFGWFNNSGSFSVTITATPPVTPTPTVPVAVPTLSPWGLVGMGLLLVGLAVWVVSRR